MVINFKEMWNTYWKEYLPSHPAKPRRTYEGYVYDILKAKGCDEMFATIASDEAWEHYNGITRYDAFHATFDEMYDGLDPDKVDECIEILKRCENCTSKYSCSCAECGGMFPYLDLEGPEFDRARAIIKDEL